MMMANEKCASKHSFGKPKEHIMTSCRIELKIVSAKGGAMIKFVSHSDFDASSNKLCLRMFILLLLFFFFRQWFYLVVILRLVNICNASLLFFVRSIFRFLFILFFILKMTEYFLPSFPNATNSLQNLFSETWLIRLKWTIWIVCYVPCHTEQQQKKQVQIDRHCLLTG